MRLLLFYAGGISNVAERDGWLFTECGGVYAAIFVCRGGYELTPVDGRVPGKWVTCRDGASPVILEVAGGDRYAARADFEAAVLANSPVWDGGTLRYHSIYGHDFAFIADADGNSTIDGEYYVKKPPVSFRSPFVNCPWCGDTVTITFGGETMQLDFSAGRDA